VAGLTNNTIVGGGIRSQACRVLSPAWHSGAACSPGEVPVVRKVCSCFARNSMQTPLAELHVVVLPRAHNLMSMVSLQGGFC